MTQICSQIYYNLHTLFLIPGFKYLLWRVNFLPHRLDINKNSIRKWVGKQIQVCLDKIGAQLLGKLTIYIDNASIFA